MALEEFRSGEGSPRRGTQAGREDFIMPEPDARPFCPLARSSAWSLVPWALSVCFTSISIQGCGAPERDAVASSEGGDSSDSDSALHSSEAGDPSTPPASDGGAGGGADARASDGGAASDADGRGSPRVPYEGIFLLGAGARVPLAARLSTIPDANRSFVDGFAMRAQWTDFDTGTSAPQYDFSVLGSAISQLQAMGKKLSLEIDALLVPPYVLHAAQETYMPRDPDGKVTIAAPVAWDTSSLGYWRTFVVALANFQVRDSASNTMVAMKDHPTLSGLRIGILGAGKLRQSDMGVLFNAPQYQRAKFIASVLTNMHDAQDQFPRTWMWIPYFSVDDGDNAPSLDSALLSAIDTEFDGSDARHPHVGFFEELLKGDSPSATSVNGMNLLAANARGGFVTFQACGSWLQQNPCTFSPGDTTPDDGFKLGYGTYGAAYYEIYKPDLDNVAWSSMFQLWHDRLSGP
jgi:hypothetical protein